MAVPTPRNGTPLIAPPKLTLRTVKGKKAHALWVHMTGVEGIGKSTFGAGAPKPLFIDVEQGTFEMDAERFVFDDKGRTQPNSWEEFRAALRVIEQGEHEFESLIVDTLDAVEALIWAHICKRDDKANVTDYGFGKGYDVAVDEWRAGFVAPVERIRARGINVITLGHTVVKTFKNPLGEDFDRYIMKLHEKAAGLIRERADIVLFANYETTIEKDKTTKRAKGVFGTRLIYTEKTAAFDAKNRHDLPLSMPLDWADFWAAVQAHKPADPAKLAANIKAVAGKIGGEVEVSALALLEQHKDNAAKLAKVLNRLNAKLAEQGEQEAA